MSNDHNDEPVYSSNMVAEIIAAKVAAERERCAKLCDELEQQHMSAMSADLKRETEHRWTAFGAEVCAHEIRTRG